MKNLTCAMLLAGLLILPGCSDETQIANPPLTKGFISEKRYIPASPVAVQGALNIGSRQTQIMITTPEMFVIIIGTKEDSGKGYNINKYSFYQVTPVTFGELSVGQEVNTKDNDAFKFIEVR